MFIVWFSQVKSPPHQEGRQMPWVGGRAGHQGVGAQVGQAPLFHLGRQPGPGNMALPR